MVPNWSPVFEYGQQPGDWSRGPAAPLNRSRLCLQPSASVPVTCLFVFLPLFGLEISCVNSKKQDPLSKKKNPLPNCLHAPQWGFVFSLCESNVPATSNYHISQMRLEENMCTQYFSGSETVSIFITVSDIFQYSNFPVGYRKL